MPELPEVETVRRGLAAALAGRVLRRVEIRREDLRRPVPAAALRRLHGRRLDGVARRGKYLLLCFDGAPPRTALVHLGMSGRLFVDPVASRSRRPAFELHEHWRMDFGDRLVRYVDARRFGILDLVARTEAPTHPLLAPLGPEPFDPAFDAAYLHARTRRRRIPLKAFLLNAREVAGIGNIYASEICHLAGLRPGRAVSRLRLADCERLVACVREVLERAIAAGGTTLRDYAGVDRAAGYFARELAVYGRAGAPCRACGASIRRTVHGGRSTFHCPRCQR